MDFELKIDNINKICIICCNSFSTDNQSNNKSKISKFCEGIREGDSGDFSSFVNCQHDVNQLDNHFGMSVCSSCLIVINELLTSKENVNLLENHVIFLQQQILKGIRDLEECLKKVKGHQNKIMETVNGSDGTCLKNKFISRLNDDGRAEESKNFVFRVRQCIRKGNQNTKRGLEGNLCIPDTVEQAQYLEQNTILIKVEQIEQNDSQGLLDDFVNAGNLSNEDDGSSSNSSTLTNNKKNLKQKFKKKAEFVPAKRKTTISKGTTLKNGKEYICKLCDGKVYRNRLSYNRHLRWHKGERNFKCECCPKSFFREDYLKDHLRTHTGERPFICDICGKGFTQGATMKKHKRNVHNC